MTDTPVPDPADSVSLRIEAAPDALYDIVSDPARMGDLSPECTGGEWLDGATGPAVGARFKGSNRDRWRRWSTTCTVVEAEPGRRFAFDVDFARVPISRWTYDFASDGNGTTVVTEQWSDRRARWMRRASAPVMGVKDRAAHNREGMQKTLAALRAAAER
jgi:hypothetical protein